MGKKIVLPKNVLQRVMGCKSENETSTKKTVTLVQPKIGNAIFKYFLKCQLVKTGCDSLFVSRLDGHFLLNALRGSWCSLYVSVCVDTTICSYNKFYWLYPWPFRLVIIINVFHYLLLLMLYCFSCRRPTSYTSI